MALTWDVSNIENRDVVTTHPADLDKLVDGKIPEGVDVRWSPTTEAILFCGMAIGMGTITEKNWREFYRRAYINERIGGAMRRYRKDDGTIESLYITAKDVHNHIGLRMNVSQETDAAFCKRVLLWAKDATDYELRAVEQPPEALPA